MNGNRGLIIATAAAFIVGCSVGLVGGMLIERMTLPMPPFGARMRGGPPDLPRGAMGPGGSQGMIDMFTRKLDLSSSQRDSLVAILDRARHDRQASRDSMEARIARVLTPEQRERWKQLETSFEHSRRRSRWPRGGPPIGIQFPRPGERNEAMRTNWWTMGVAALMAMTPVATAHAQEAPPRPRARMEARDREERPGQKEREALRERLHLTDEQRRRLEEIRDRRERQVIPIQADLRTASLDLRKLVRADRPDRRAIDAQIDRIASLRASMQKTRMASMIEARSVLTAEQQKRMREHRARGMDFMDGPGRRMEERRRMRTF